ncbi:uncharacterized protein B0J16DRAFT_367828 [Fusarium flagelliforme]|uniref:uncharacterized protein n=1 Tax=Fusarium flagelliforme TaxID=2675880 RepID=UPI001E8EE19D|nr:uncharacterized protein B0J16DRAFT_367828 [Fusarium flagelliforme]KAH7198794.1 hypothetical protein B0J16DRAFT_367828 [Fusarium flagelliforme]
MSTGKAKSSFGVIKLRSTLRERFALSDEEKLESGSFKSFRPSLYLEPVATIVQTVREAVNHFPDLRCIVFYSHPSQFPVKNGVEVKDRKSIHPLLRQLSSNAAKLSPATGKTVIFSTYPTISKRWLDKESELFLFTTASEKGQAHAQKKKKGKKKRLRKYTSLEEDEYITLEKGQRAKADGELVTYFWRDICVKEYEFDLIILDEAQYLRRTSGSYSNLLRLLNWRRMLFVTGTPIAGSLRDLLSPLTLIAHTNPSIGGYRRGKILGETRGIFSETFWKELEEQGAVHQELLQSLGQFASMARVSDTLKPWFLSPDLLQAAAKELSWGVNLGTKVVRPLLKVLYTRRTMKTELFLPDGTKPYPSDGMLPCTIRVEECSYFEDGPFGDDAVPEHTQAGDQPAQDTSQEVHMNFGAHRAGVISAFDTRTVKMLDNETPAFYGDKCELVNRFATLADEISMTQSRKKNAKKLQSGAEIVGLGVEHIELLLRKTDNGGLHYVYDCCKVDEDLGYDAGMGELLAMEDSRPSRPGYRKAVEYRPNAEVILIQKSYHDDEVSPQACQRASHQAPQMLMLLANEMGTGKTKTFLAALPMRIARLAAQGGYKKFKPTSGVKVLTQEQLADKLKALRSKEAMKDPETGRIIVFSTYPTLSARWLATDREPFVWADDVEIPTKTSERTKKQCIRSYTKETIDTGKIAKLPKGDTGKGCDGELVNYHLSKPAAEKFEFDMLI